MMSWIDSRHRKISTCLHFQNGRHNTAKNQAQNLSQCRISLSTHTSNFDDIGQCWIFTAHFLCRVLAAILKMTDILKILKRRIAPLMVTYHYVKFYVSIIIHLEVIKSKFDVWVDNDIPNWFPTLKNFYLSPFSKWPPQYRKNSMADILKIWKTQNCSSNGDLSLCQILCLYHYPVRSYQH
jgi:hypothetical protein